MTHNGQAGSVDGGWHVPADALQAWADGSGGMAAGASVEQHLLACDRCRARVAALEEPALLAAGPELDLDTIWTGIRERVEPPPLNAVGRVLRALGVRESDAILLSGAPSLTGAWFIGIVLVVLFALAAASSTGDLGPSIFLILAPMLPVAGVAAAYGSDVDPTHELTLAAPYSKLRLLLLRTGAVLVTCVPVTLCCSILIDGPGWVSVVWLLPAMAFVLTSLATATFAPPVYSAGTIALVWVGLTAPDLIRREPLTAFDATALVTYLVIAAVASVVLATRASRLATDRRLR